MGFDALEAMSLIAREKNIDMNLVVETVEAGLLAAARKKYGYIDNLSFKFDHKEGELTMIALKTVVKKVTDHVVEISLDEARELDPEAELDDQMEIYIDPVEEFGRSAITSAKQILIQRIREAERDRIYDEYISRVGQLVSGSVQQIDKGNVIVNLGRAEAILPGREQISREKYRQGDRVRAIILDVQKSMKGPQIVLSRASTEFIMRLFELEVPEIFEKIIEIKAIAREPGERTKLAVYSADERIDPVGACVGIKGVRVQSIVRELNNERIDIVAYSGNPELFVSRALAPAKVVTIDIYHDDEAMTVAVEDDKLSLAIGKNGQNARLASRLTGWKINIMSETEYNEVKRREAEMMVPIGKLAGVGDILEERLVEADITTVQDLATADLDDIMEIEGIGAKTAERLIERAQEYMTEVEEQYQAQLEAEAVQAAEEAEAEAAEAEEEGEEVEEQVEEKPEEEEGPLTSEEALEAAKALFDDDMLNESEDDSDEEESEDDVEDDEEEKE